MNDSLLKGSIVFLALMIVFVSMACVSAESNDTSVLTLSKSGITIKYQSHGQAKNGIPMYQKVVMIMLVYLEYLWMVFILID